MFAQAGAAGGHVGGGLAGGGGLSGTGRPTGVDAKDDLRDFHAALAVQATTAQTISYRAMLKSTDAALAQLRSFIDTAAQQSPADLATRAAALAKTVEAARVENKTFVDTFSEPQRSGLREVTKRLLKADAELEQQSRMFSAQFESAKQQVANVTALGAALEAALTSFHGSQMELGEQLSIVIGDHGANESYDLVPAKTAIKLGNQGITITTSGMITQHKSSTDESVFAVELERDLSELQQNIVGILNAKFGKSDRCGNQVEILDATLGASAPVSVVTIRLHFERWLCMGGGVMNEMAEGNGSIELKLSPSIADDGKLRMTAEISRIDAGGLLGESLRSGSLGDEIRENVNAILFSVVHDATDFKDILPAAAWGHATLTHARFESTGRGRLILVLDGEVRLSPESAKVLMTELQRQPAAPAAASQAATR